MVLRGRAGEDSFVTDNIFKVAGIHGKINI